ncbi:MAG: DUF58 domain-containing protein [Phycisphaeraceae bacterium]
MVRHRIQIGPGGMVYGIVAVLIFGAATYTQANLLFLSFGLMVGGLVTSILLSIRAMRKVTITRLPPSHGVVGEPMVIRYRIENRRRFMPLFNLVVREHWGKGRRGWRRTGPVAERPQRLGGQPVGWVMHLGPRETIQAEAIAWPLKRGTLTFDRIELSTSFPFGVIRKVIDIQQRDDVVVYPKLYRVNRRLLGRLTKHDMTGRKARSQAGGQEEFFGLRAYRYGDNFKSIDWKHSARTGDLMSREFTHPAPPKIMLMLDLSPPAIVEALALVARQATKKITSERKATVSAEPLSNAQRRRLAARPDPNDPIERAISLAASLICDAYFYGYQVGLLVRGPRCASFAMHHSLPHRTRLLEALASLDMNVQAREEPVMLAEPSVLVHPGESERSVLGGRCVVLPAARLSEYVREAEVNMSILLATPEAALSRRQDADDPFAMLRKPGPNDPRLSATTHPTPHTPHPEPEESSK